jgi:hypothetical protein
MASIRQSTSTKPNAAFTNAEAPAKKSAVKAVAARSAKAGKSAGGGGNMEWFRESAKKLEAKTFLMLLGGSGAAHVRLRTAQSTIRRDMTPSHWSHVVLCTDKQFKRGKEVAVAPPISWNFPPASNGLINVFLSAYDDPEEFPNVALIGVPVEAEKVEEAADNFWKVRRDGLDAVEMMLRWLGFLWGVEGAHNPLEEGIGVPSAAMVDYVLSAVSYDLTPALNSRSSCPEAIWQSAKWWSDYHTADSQKGLSGAYLVRHCIVPEHRA